MLPLLDQVQKLHQVGNQFKVNHFLAHLHKLRYLGNQQIFFLFPNQRIFYSILPDPLL